MYETASSHTRAVLVFAALCVGVTASVHGQRFSLFETQNSRILYYSKTHEYLVPYIARNFENSHRFHRQLFDWSPSEKVTILVTDFEDYGHAGAKTIPENFVLVGISPFRHAYEDDAFSERLRSIMSHELVHLVASDKASGSDQFFRSMFGGKVVSTSKDPISIVWSFLTTPRWYSPRWYHEGAAVFVETWMSGGLGRALSGYDEMAFRTVVRDSAEIYDFVGLESEGTTIDFQVGVNSYLYGTRFISYLALVHGPEKVVDWVSRSDGSRKTYAGQFRQVFGRSLVDEWEGWTNWERDWQGTNIDRIRANPLTPYRQVTKEALGSVSKSFYDSTRGVLYGATYSPGQVATIASIDVGDGRIQALREVKGPSIFQVTSMAFDGSGRRLFYTTDNKSWRDLHVYDLKSGRSTVLQKNVRVGDIAFNSKDGSLWGVRHLNGLSTLVRIPAPYDEWYQVHTFPYAKNLYHLDISADGTMIAAALSDVTGEQRLVKFETDAMFSGNQLKYDTLFTFNNSSASDFVFSQDGKYLFGTSYYTGVSNVYRYDLHARRMQILTNSETGMFRPVPISSDSLLVFNYTSKGFLPVIVSNEPAENVGAIRFLGNEVATRYQTVRDWHLGSASSINIDSIAVADGSYSALKQLGFTSWYPIVEGYKDDVATGVRVDLSDHTGVAAANLSVTISPSSSTSNDEKFHARAELRNWGWSFLGTYNRGDFYDLFGPTKTSRKGYSFGVSYRKVLANDDSRKLSYRIAATAYGGLDRLPEAQNIRTDVGELYSGRASVGYSSIRRSLGAVDDEKGFSLDFVSANQFVSSRLYPKLYADYSVGTLLPLSHSSVWIRTSVGVSFGDSEDPFANYYFGGFGNNWVDFQNEKRYREHYSLPGVPLNAVSGLNYTKATLEWNLPPIRFRRAGYSWAYLRWARPALFTTGIAVNLDSKSARSHAVSLGGQIDFRLVFFSYFPMTLSVGYAQARRDQVDWSDELMFSLKILD